jgi:hypothetical protein
MRNTHSKSLNKIFADNTLKRSCTMIKKISLQGCKDGTNLQINKGNAVISIKDKKIIISIDAVKSLTNIQRYFMIYSLKKVGIEGIFLNIIKSIYANP